MGRLLVGAAPPRPGAPPPAAPAPPPPRAPPRAPPPRAHTNRDTHGASEQRTRAELARAKRVAGPEGRRARCAEAAAAGDAPGARSASECSALMRDGRNKKMKSRRRAIRFRVLALAALLLAALSPARAAARTRGLEAV